MKRKEISRLIASTLTATVALNSYSGNIRVVSATTNSNVSTLEESEDDDSVNESNGLSDLSGVSTEQMQIDFESVADDNNNKNSSEDSSSDDNNTTSDYSSTSEDINSSEENKTPVVSEDFNIASSSKRLISTLSETVTESQFVYLSDIKNDINLSSLDWALKLDKSSSGEGIHLLVDGQDRTFTKGIGVDSNAILVYDVSAYANKYTRLVGYIGVDYRQKNQTIADGVDFTVEVSEDGTEWRVARDIGIIKASQEAYKLDLNLEGVKYVRLSALAGKNKSYDHAVFADFKLAQSDYNFTAQDQTSVSFSFSGSYANKLLVDTNKTEEISYSLDGGNEWKSVTKSSVYNGCKVINLSNAEVESITADNDIKIKIGSNIYVVDITKSTAPTTGTIYGNDWEDRLVGSIDNLQYRLNENDSWKDYTSVTKFEGNQTIEVRYKASGTAAASSSIQYTFTASNDADTRKYVSLSEVSLHTFCSEETSKAKSYARYLIDGDINTMWHNNWNGEDDLYYSVEFNEIKYISSIEYLPALGNGNGRLRDGEILVSYDGVEWTSAGTFTGLKNNTEWQTINLSNPLPAKFLKIKATQTWGSVQNKFFTGRMINFYEDTTKEALTEPMLTYSKTEKTTEPVTVSVVYPENCTASEKSYKFLENGSHTFYYTDLEGNQKSITATVSNIVDVATNRGVYLSDLDTISTSVGSGSYMKDKNPSGGTISLIVDGTTMNFKKGIGIHAPSTVIYDIERFSNEYSKFVGYVGVDSSRGTNGSVAFTVSASNDGKTWTTLQTTDVLRGNTESVYVDVNVKGYKYLKIYGDQTPDWNGSDHSVVADARLIKEGYSSSSEYYAGFKTLAQYDQEISSRSVEENYASHKKQILEREFVNRYGYNNIISASRDVDGVYEALDWLQHDENALQLLIEAGDLFSGNGYNALKALGGLYKEFREDLSTPIYKKMILATVAAYSKDIRPFMVNYGGNWVGANPVETYRAFREIYNSDTKYGFVRKDEFNSYSMELIRSVMDSRLNYDELIWLRAYIEKKYPIETNKNNWVRYNGYGYARYVNTGYWQDDMYIAENKEKWDEKYNLSEYGVPYPDWNFRAWMFMEKGAICWGLSGLGMTVNEVQGIPAVGTFQPGHEAYLLYSQNSEGKGIWSISDDIAGWGSSFSRWGGTTTTEHRLLLGWGQKEYNTLNGGNNTSYMLLAQDALNDYDNYLESMFYNLIANSYEKGSETHEAALNESLEHYSKNLDSIYNLYKSYLADESTTDEEWADLAEMVAEEYKYFPAPMVDLLKLIKAQIEDESLKISVDIMQNNSLKAASVATSKESLQNGACQQVAKSLLGNNSTELATFSFTGENANKIIINDRYANSTIQVRVSLDGGKTWEIFNGKDEFTTDHVIELTKEQISRINADDDILVGLMGRPENHTIDIKAGKTLNMSNIYKNDQENSLIGGDLANLEYSTDGGDNWHDYVGGLNPNVRFEGNVEVSFRYKANGLTLPSNISTLKFTDDGDTAESKYVSLSNVSLFAYSSEQINSATPGPAKNIIDGNYNTRYHSTWDRADNEKYLVFEFDKVRFINKIGYMPFNDDSGEMKSGNVYVSMDGVNWTHVYTYENMKNISSPEWKYIELGDSYAAKYIKIDSTASYGDSNKYFAGRMLSFYEDTTKEYDGDPGIRYSTIDKTSQYVVAELILEEGYTAEVTSHKFTENGSYNFVYTNKKGETKTVTATVNNIIRDLDSTSVYLTDLNYESSSYAGWNGIRYDLAPGGKKINLKIDGTKKEFNRGIGAHTNSELIYDIGMFTDVYNKFKAYVGVDGASGGGSVNFKILASKNGQDWDELKATDTLTVSTNAVLVDVDVTGYAYLKLIADGGADTSNDHAVYADAKLVRDKAMVKYSTSESGEVTAKLYLPDGCTVVGESTHVFDGNGKHTFEYTNSSNEKQTIEAIVDWFENDTAEKDDNIDEGFGIESEDDKDIADQYPDVDEDFGMSDPSTSDKDENIDDGFGVESEDDIDTSEKDENVDDSFLVEDTREFEVEFNKETLTNQDVIATLVGLHEGDEVVGGETHIFTENGKYAFVIRDSHGNEFTKEVEVTWIDKKEVTAIVSYDYSKVEEGIVIAKVTGFNKEGVVVTNTTDHVDYVEFKENDSFTFEFVDKAGNTGKVTANIDWFKFEDLETIVSYEDVVETPSEEEENVVPDYVIAKVDIDTEKIEIVNNEGSNEVKFIKNGVFAFRARMIETGEEFEILVQVDWLAETAEDGESPVELPNDTAEQEPSIDDSFLVPDEDNSDLEGTTSEDDENIDDSFLIPDEDNSDLEGTTSEDDENIDDSFLIPDEDNSDLEGTTSEDDENVDDSFLVPDEDNSDLEGTTSEDDESIDDSFLIPDEDNSNLEGTTSEDDSTDEDQTPVIPPVVEETPVVPPVTPDNGNNSGNANNSGNSSNSGSVNGGSGSGSSGGSGSNGGNGDGDDPNNGNSSDKDPNVDDGFGVESEDDKDISEKDENVDNGFLVGNDSLLNSLLNPNGSDKRNPIKDLISMGINASISGTVEIPNRNESSKNETSSETNANTENVTSKTNANTENVTSNNSHSNSSNNSSNTHHKGFIEIVVDTVGEVLGDFVSSTMGTISTATSSIFVWIRRFFGMGR